MNSACKSLFAAARLALVVVLCVTAMAQGPAEMSSTTGVTRTDSASTPPTAGIPADPLPQLGGINPNADTWRVGISIYGWFPGVHGTVGVLGHDASVQTSFSDVFHVLKGIIPIAVEADRGRFVMPIDYLWIKLGDDKSLPLNDLGQTSVDVHLTQSILTPKVGYRALDGEHFKMDVLGGIR